MQDLIERLEKLNAGPSLILNAEIANAVGALPTNRHDLRYTTGEIEAEWPFYTSSLDAAIKLVPEGWRTERVCQGLRGEGAWQWVLAPIVEGAGHYGNQHHASQEVIGFTSSGVPARALCIAALKARTRYEL
jgi:hypothetical protein